MEDCHNENRELRRLLRDLVALATTPAGWVGRDRAHIAESVADIVLHTLRAEAIYVCLEAPKRIEILRSAQHPGFVEEVRRAWPQSATANLHIETITAPNWPSTLRVALQPIGFSGDDGFIAVGCSGSTFPSEGESLLLSVAANQTAVALQTARLRTEADLERQRLRDVLAQAPAAMGLLAGPEHRWVYVNENYVRVTGRDSASDFIGRTLLESLPEIKHQPFLQMLDDVYRTGKPHVGREVKAMLNRAHTGQSEEAYFDFVYQPVLNAEGVSDGILVHAVEVTDKVTARMAIEQSEERLRAIVETTPECVKLVAADGTLLHMNSAGLSMIGADCAEAAIGRNIYEVIAPEDRARFREFNEAICRGERGSTEFDIVGLKGVRRHMETHSAPLRQPDGNVVQLAVTRDVTERKQAEEEQRRKEEEFHVLADAVPQLVWMANPDGWIFWYNSRWYEYTGTRPEQMQGWGWQSVHDRAVLPRVLERWKASINTGEPFEMTFPLRGADGEFRPFLTRVIPVRDSSGKITRWFGTNTDVSNEVKVQQKLQNALIASERLAAIVESSDDAIVGKDLNGIVSSWNPAAERIFGYTAREMIGRSITTIIPPELQDDEKRILATIGRGERIEHFETVRVRKGGERIEVSLTISPVRDETGKIIGAAKIARDITQQKKAERALHTSERLAAVGRLAATVAHEINNPLAAVTNFVYLGKQRAVRDDVREFLTGAQEELKRISHLTRQTLGFYRETQGASCITLGSALQSLVPVFSYKTRHQAIDIRTEIRQDPQIYAIPGEIRQLVANLLSNSIDAVGTAGKIRVRVSASSTYNGTRAAGVKLTIADSGPGIPLQALSRLFEPFFTTKKDVGTGLGLWICKNIVEKHHGWIRVKTSTVPGRSGTVFSVFLPANSQPTAPVGMEDYSLRAV
jgi:PAS domain S-box-containing protein